MHADCRYGGRSHARLIGRGLGWSRSGRGLGGVVGGRGRRKGRERREGETDGEYSGGVEGP